MFPLRDDNPTLSSSVVTVALVVVNVLCWVLIQGLGTEPALSKSVCELGAIPGELLGRVAPGTAVPPGGSGSFRALHRAAGCPSRFEPDAVRAYVGRSRGKGISTGVSGRGVKYREGVLSLCENRSERIN